MFTHVCETDPSPIYCNTTDILGTLRLPMIETAAPPITMTITAIASVRITVVNPPENGQRKKVITYNSCVIKKICVKVSNYI